MSMKLKNQGKFLKIISLILLISWLSLIFYFSNQKGSISESSSNFVIDLLNTIFKNFNLDIKSIESISFIVRKSAHMFLYFVLYFLTFYTMYQFNIRKRKILSFLFCLFYAISDEFHQLFIPNRSFMIRDIFIDMLGSSFAYLILFIKNKLNGSINSCKL